MGWKKLLEGEPQLDDQNTLECRALRVWLPGPGAAAAADLEAAAEPCSRKMWE